jgi:hypothetical protein
MVADQLIEDYRNATHESEGNMDAVSTIDSWHATARAHGDEFTEDDWIALVQELVRRLAEGE